MYFKCDEYITIEVRVKDKPVCEYTKNDKHKKRCLMSYIKNSCMGDTRYQFYWEELQYIKNRRDNDISQYKSQSGRYLDIQ